MRDGKAMTKPEIVKRSDCRYDYLEIPTEGISLRLVRFWSARDEFFALLNMPGAE